MIIKFRLYILLIFIGCQNTRQFPSVVKIDDSVQTGFISCLEKQVEANKNFIYCPTLLYAWNEIKNSINDKIEIDPKSNDLNLLNNSTTFQGALNKKDINNSISFDDSSIFARSYFDLMLPFKFEFYKNNYPMVFDQEKIESFGLNGRKRV